MRCLRRPLAAELMGRGSGAVQVSLNCQGYQDVGEEQPRLPAPGEVIGCGGGAA